MPTRFYFTDLTPLGFKWTIFRNGTQSASGFDSRQEAVEYAKGFCNLNGLIFQEVAY